jgi:hypothetical protein
MKARCNKWKYRTFSLVFGIFVLLSCANKTVTFAVRGNGKVSIVSPDNLDKVGQFLGDTPLTVEVSKLQGKIVKISQNGKIPAYWIMPDISGQNLKATLALQDEPKSPPPQALAEKPDGKPDLASKQSDPKATINRLMRLILKSYKALASRNLSLAKDLADRASSIDPELAAPLVIKGIALMQSGDSTGARAALSNAQALDPEDRDIETLLKAIR